MTEMKRLTFEGNFCDIAMCRENPCPYNGSCSQKETWERLKQYEDTGLSPEELKSLIPVPIGTPVYNVVSCGCYPQYAERCQARQASKTDKRMKTVAIICLGKARTRTTCAKIYERPFAISHIGKVGKTVFLTIEDAVASLKKEG